MLSTMDAAQTRYVQDVLAVHERLSFGGLVRHLSERDVPWLVTRPDGLATLAARTDQIPHRYLLGLQGFRLAQYLKLGYASNQVVYARSLFCEPSHALHPTDIHVVTLDQPSGRILGYVGLASSADAEPRDPAAEDRAPFPCEVAHGVNVFARVRPMPDLHTHEVREVKRFVHDRSLTDRTLRLRVSLELLLGLGRALQAAAPAVRVLVGDVEERVALRHLLLMGLDVYLLEGTRPVLPAHDLMHPMYEVRDVVKPFVACAPTGDELRRRTDLVERAVTGADLFAGAGLLVQHLTPTLQRVAA